MRKIISSIKLGKLTVPFEIEIEEREDTEEIGDTEEGDKTYNWAFGECNKREDIEEQISLREYLKEKREKKQDLQIVFIVERKGKWNEVQYRLEGRRYPVDAYPTMTNKQITSIFNAMGKIKNLLKDKEDKGEIIIPKVQNTYYIPLYSEGSYDMMDMIIYTMLDRKEIYSENEDFKVTWA